MTFVPVQMDVDVALSVTAGISVGFTVMVTPGLVAVAGDAQVALDVSTTEYTSPLAAVVVE